MTHRIRKEKIPNTERGGNTMLGLRKAVVLAALLLVAPTLACTLGSGSTNEDDPGVSPRPEAPTNVSKVPNLEVMAEESSQDVVGIGEEPAEAQEEGVCQGGRWRIVPLAVYEYPLGDGWKLLIIPLAVENGSELWGNFRGPLSYSGYNLTTEEEYTYGPYRVNYLRLPPEVPSPYTEYAEVAKQDGFFIHSKIRVLGVLPPGFRSRGDSFDIGPTYWGVPDSWSQVLFQVAENQEQFKLTIQGASVSCILPDGTRESEILGPFELDLNSDTAAVVFPSEKLADNISQDISSPFEIGGASLQITNVYRDDPRFGDEPGGMVVIKFRVENLSGGYEASGEIRSYLIGDDGLIRTPGCEHPWSCIPDGAPVGSLGHYGRFQVGPGQTSEASIGFLAHPSVKNLKFVVTHAQEGVYQVFDLPDDF